jgi:hypothetical protein
VSGPATFVDETSAVSWLPLTNDVVRDEPFQTTTELLLKLPPSTVKTNPTPPAVALLGEIEVTDGVAGHPPQETTESNKIADPPKSADIFIAIGVHLRQISGRADLLGWDFERIISVATQLVGRVDMIISPGAPFLAFYARSGTFSHPATELPPSRRRRAVAVQCSGWFPRGTQRRPSEPSNGNPRIRVRPKYHT